MVTGVLVEAGTFEDLSRKRNASTANIVAVNSSHAQERTTAMMEPNIILTSTIDKVSRMDIGLSAW